MENAAQELMPRLIAPAPGGEYQEYTGNAALCACDPCGIEKVQRNFNAGIKL